MSAPLRPGASPYGPPWAAPPRESYTWTSPADGEIRSFPVPPTWGPSARAGSARVTNNTRGILYVQLGTGRTPSVEDAATIVGPYSTSTVALDADGISALWEGTVGDAGGRTQSVSIELVAAPAPPTSSSLATPPVAGRETIVWTPASFSPDITITPATPGMTNIMSAIVVNESPYLVELREDAADPDPRQVIPAYCQRAVVVGRPSFYLSAIDAVSQPFNGNVYVELFDTPGAALEGPAVALPSGFAAPVSADLQRGRVNSTVASYAGTSGYPGLATPIPMVTIGVGVRFLLNYLEVSLAVAQDGLAAHGLTVESSAGMDGNGPPQAIGACIALTNGADGERLGHDRLQVHGPMVFSNHAVGPVYSLQLVTNSPAPLVWQARWTLIGWYL